MLFIKTDTPCLIFNLTSMLEISLNLKKTLKIEYVHIQFTIYLSGVMKIK
jgi:hypothetical protein